MTDGPLPSKEESPLTELCPKCSRRMFNWPGRLTKCVSCLHEWYMDSGSQQETSREPPHVHTDECWEPDSGCDMGRNARHVKAVSDAEDASLREAVGTKETSNG